MHADGMHINKSYNHHTHPAVSEWCVILNFLLHSLSKTMEANEQF
jgi:hypothetical protein